MQHEIFIQKLDLDELMQEAIDEALGRVRSGIAEDLRDERMGAFLGAVFAEVHGTEPPSNSADEVFRPVYRQLTDYQKAAIDDIKGQAAQLLSLVDAASTDARCAALARTKLEEAVMWAVKGVS